MAKYHSKWRDLIRSLILCRDAYKCYVCSFQSLSNHVHHIDSNPSNNHPSNLVTLCIVHHASIGKSRFKIEIAPIVADTAIKEFFHTQIIYILQVQAAKISTH
jgi:hypothetical protein